MPYHVRLAAGPFGLRTKELFNLDPQRLGEITGPWRGGEPIVIEGRRWIPDATKITVYEGAALTSNQRSMWQGWAKAIEFGENVTEAILGDGLPESLKTSADAPSGLDPEELDAQLIRHQDWDARNVAVAYGGDDAARQTMFGFLRALGLQPLEWSTLVAATQMATPSTFSAVRHAFEISQAVVVLFTPDDEARLHDSLKKTEQEESTSEGQPRQNVLLEAGMALAYHPSRTIIVEIGRLRPATNLAGLNTVRIDGSTAPLNELATRLEHADCPVRRDGTDWLDPSRFAHLDALTRMSAPAAERPVALATSRDSTPDGAAESRGTPTGGGFPGVDEDSLAEVAAAVRRAGLADDTRRDLVIISFLNQRDEPFHGGELAQALPAPALLGEEMKRLLSELYRSQLIGRNEDGRRGWLSRRR